MVYYQYFNLKFSGSSSKRPKQNRKIYCPQCQQFFITKLALDLHIYENHSHDRNINKSPTDCNVSELVDPIRYFPPSHSNSSTEHEVLELIDSDVHDSFTFATSCAQEPQLTSPTEELEIVKFLNEFHNEFNDSDCEPLIEHHMTHPEFPTATNQKAVPTIIDNLIFHDKGQKRSLPNGKV